MAAVISSEHLGLYNSSRNTIGEGGNSQVGQQGNQVYLNTATGNLVVQQRDEFIASQGPDFSLIRTYNSQGEFDGDNNDHWRLNIYQSLSFFGTPNTVGSTITKTNGDSSESVYQYEVSGNRYISTDGSGAHDTLKQNGSEWVWSSGDGTITQSYNSLGQLIRVQDADGNTRNYSYSGSLITQISDSSGQTITLDYSGNNLQKITTLSAGVTQSRVSYGYDSDRLTSVTLDLSPEDNSINDGNIFTTTYTYDGSSKRIASIVHSDGTGISFTYDTNNRISTVIEGGEITEYRYGESTEELSIAANTTELQNTINHVALTAQLDDTQLEVVINNSVDYSLKDNSYTIQAGDSWESIAQARYGSSAVADELRVALGDPILTANNPLLDLPDALQDVGDGVVYKLDISSIQSQDYVISPPSAVDFIVGNGNSEAISNLQIAHDNAGNCFAIWEQDTGTYQDLYYSQYNVNTGEWSPAAEFYSGSSDSTRPQVVYDAAGNVTVVWYQSYNLYAKRFDHGQGVWQSETVLGGVSRENPPKLSVDGAGNVMAVWENIHQNQLNVGHYSITNDTWSTTLIVDDANVQLNNSAIKQNANGQALLVWSQVVETSGQPDTLDYYYATYDNSNGWQPIGGQMFQSGLYDSSREVDLEFNNQGDAILVWGEHGNNSRVAAIRYTNGAWENAFDVEGPVNWMNGSPEVHLDEQGNAIVLWESNLIKARRFDVSTGWGESIELSPTLSGHNYYHRIEGTADGHAVAIWQDNGFMHTARYERGVGWHASESVTAVDTLGGTAITVDANNTAQFAWINTQGTDVTIQSSRTTYTAVDVPPYYIAQAGDTWESLSLKFYGSSDGAYALQSATGNSLRTLVPGLKISGIPSTINNAQAYPLNSQSVSYSNASVTATSPLTSAGNSQAISEVQLTTDAHGNRFAIWEQNTGAQTDLYFSQYTAANDQWSTAAEFYRGNTSSLRPQAMYDETGNLTVAWYKGYELYAQHYDAAQGVWSGEVSLGSIFREYPPKMSSDGLGNITVIATNYYYGQVRVGHYSVQTKAWSSELVLDDDTVTPAGFNIAQNAQGQTLAVWYTKENSTREYFYDLYTAAEGWQGAQWFHSGPNISDGDLQLAFNDQGDALVSWTEQHNGTMGYIKAMRYGGGAWQSEFTLDSTSLWINNSSEVHLDEQGNAMVLWGTDKVKARRFDINSGWGAVVELSPTSNANHRPRISGNDDGHATAVWEYGGDFYAAEYIPGQGWQAAQQIAVSGTVAGTAVSVDRDGNAQLLWINNDGSNRELNSASLSASTPSYTVAANDTWGSLATTLYGQASLSHELSLAFNQASPTVGATITPPGQLIEGGIDTMAPYYVIKQGDTWDSIASTLYGSSAVADELQTALGDPTLQAGSLLTGLPETLDDMETVTVPYYYQVQAGDTWSSIAQTVYGTSQVEVVEALKDAMGSPTLAAGLRLTVSQTLDYSRLTNEANTTSVIDPLGRISSYRYDSEGKLTEVLSPALTNGQRLRTQYQYDAQDNLTRVIDGQGHAIDYSYDAMGNLTRQQDAAGNVVTYSYTSSNQLASKTVYLSPDPDGAGVLSAADPQTTNYIYDSEDHLRFMISANGGVTEHRYASNGNRTTTIVYTGNTYTELSNLTETNLSAWVNSVADLAQTQRSDYQYDFRGQLSSATAYSSTNADGSGSAGTEATTHFIYDQAGQLLKSVDARGSAPINNGTHQANNYETHYVYDGLGRLTQSTNALGHSTNTLYNDANQRIETTLANGLVRTTVYDNRGRIVSVSEYAPSDLATPLSETRSRYDANNRLRATQDANGVITHKFYDEAGRLVASIDGIGALTENIYDNNGQLIQQIRYATLLDVTALSALVNTDANGVLQSTNDIPLALIRPQSHIDDRSNYYYYNQASQLVFTIDGEGYVTEYQYDGAGQRIETIQHSAPFPGFISNVEAGAQITNTSTATLLEWKNNNIPSDSQITTMLIEEETGDAIKVNVDLSTNTGTVETTHVPTQIFESDNFSVTDSRSLVSDSETISTQHLTEEISGSTSINRTTAYQTTVQDASLTITNATTYNSSNASQSGSTTTVTSISSDPDSAWWTVHLYKEVSGSWVSQGFVKHTSRPTSLSYSDLSSGDYKVDIYETELDSIGRPKQLSYPTGGTTFFIGKTYGSVVEIPSVSGATQVDFYHRTSTGTGASGYTVDNEHGFTINLSSTYNTGSKSVRDFKVVYKNSAGAVIAIGVGLLTINEGGSSTSSFKIYNAVSTSSGVFLRDVLTDTEVGTLGDEKSTTLSYVEAFVYNVETPTVLVSSAKTYPNVVKAVTGEASVNLSLNGDIPNGLYNIVIKKYYANGNLAGTQEINNYQIGVAVDHVQEITWSSALQEMRSDDKAFFYFRPKNETNPQPYTVLTFDDSSIQGLNTYFTRSGSQYKARLFGLNENADYEFYIEYRASDERLLKWSGSAGAPNTFNVNQTTDLAVDFKYNQDESSNINGGTRLLGVLSPQEVQAVDYLSVNVIDTETNAKVNTSPVITIPRVEENYLGSLNISAGEPLSDGRYRIEVTRYFKDERIPPQFDHFIHEVGMQLNYSIEHSNTVDDLASLDTRTLVQSAAAVSNVYTVDTFPQTVVTGAAAYQTSSQALNLQVTNATIQHSSNVSHSSSSTTISNVAYSPSVGNVWVVKRYRLVPGSASVHENTITFNSPPSIVSYGSLAPGNYVIQVFSYIMEEYDSGQGSTRVRRELETSPSGGASFTVGQTYGSVVHIPSVSGASQVDFYHRAEGISSGGYILDDEHDFNIDILSSYNNQWRDFKIVYKNSSGQVLQVSIGKFYSSESGTTNRTIYSYSTTSTSGTYLSNVLTSGEVGTFGDETGSTLGYVDVNVYYAGTTTLVSSARTYPSVMRAIYGIYDRVNLTVGSALGNGFYDIVINKFYNNGSSVPGAQRLNNVQIGNVYKNIQTISWPSSVQTLGAGETATFFYRPAGASGFTALALSASASGNQYFIQSGGQYQARLYNIPASTNYEYYIEYRGANQRLLNSSGSASNPNTFNSSETKTADKTFSQYAVSLTTTAGDNGTRLTGYLSAAEISAIDYVSVNVINDATNQPVYTDVLTVPRAEANYQGSVNLSQRMALLPGRYRVEITRYFNDERLTPQTETVIHEVTHQVSGRYALNVSANGNVVTASYAGNLQMANGLSLVIDTENDSLAWNIDQLNQGPYRYTQRIDAANSTSYTEDSGRLAAYAGDTPTIDALQGFYDRSRTVNVTIEQGTSLSYRSPKLPNGIGYLGSAQGSTTVTNSIPLDLTVIADPTDTSSNVLSGNLVSLSETGDYLKSPEYIVYKFISVVNVATGETVYTQASPGTSTRTYSDQRGGAAFLRQIPQLTSFTLPSNVLLNPGDYVVRVNKIIRIEYREWVNNNWKGEGEENFYSERYAYGAVSDIQIRIGGLPDKASVRWDVSSLPNGSTYTFKYRAVGTNVYRNPVSLQLVGGNVIANLGDDAVGFYDYVIEYRDAYGEVTNKSEGQFQLKIGGNHTTVTQENMLVYQNLGVSISGSSIIHNAYALQGGSIDYIQAWVYDAATQQLIGGGPVTTVPGSFSNYIGQINLRTGTILDGGVYHIDLQINYTNGTVETPTRFTIEVGPQAVESPATELRWDAINRPPNTNVYFRYKPIAEKEYDPQNMWIRATASQTIQGEYYVKFPQMTPDGQLLARLDEGEYDYMVIYLDRDTGKEIETSMNRFNVIHQTGLSNHHDLVFSRDLDAREERMFYNAQGQLLAVLNALGYLSENSYDTAGQLIQTIQYANQSSPTFWQLGSLEQLRPAVSADDVHRYVRYNGQGLPVLSVNAEGFVTETVYDAVGNVTQTVAYANPTTSSNIMNDSLASIIPTASAVYDRITQMSYTALNQVATITTKVGSSTISVQTYEYDAMGNLIRTRSGVGSNDERSANNRYDLQGRLIEQLDGNGSQVLADLMLANASADQTDIDAIWSEHSVQYDYTVAGQQKQVTDQNDHSTRVYYDGRGQLRYSINAMGEVQETIYNSFAQVSHTIMYANRIDQTVLASMAGGILTQSVRNTLDALRDPSNDTVQALDYDNRGQVVVQKDALGNETNYQHNAFGEVRFETEKLKGGDTDGQTYTTEHIYDALGREVTTLGIGADGQLNRGTDYDAFGQVTASYTYDQNQNLFNHYANRYDNLGRVIETLEVRTLATTEVAAEVHSINGYIYDAFNRVLTQTDGNGQSTHYSYDDVNQTVTITTPEGISQSSKTNQHGETIEITDGNGNLTTFAYDKNGQLIKSTDGEGNQVINEYDAAGRLTFTTNANGTKVQTFYDAANRVIERIVDPMVVQPEYSGNAHFTAGFEFQVNTTTANTQNTPQITALKDGGYLAVWRTEVEIGNIVNIVGQRYNRDGQRVGSELQIGNYSGISQSGLDSTTLADGSVVVVWNVSAANGNGASVYARHYASNGAALGDAFIIGSVSSNARTEPSVTALSSGGFIISTTWNDGVDVNVVGQRYDAQATAVGSEFILNDYLVGNLKASNLAGLSDGGFVAVWQSYGQDGSQTGVYGQRFDENGAKVGSEFQANTYTSLRQQGANVAALSDGGFIIAWHSFNQDGSVFGIYAQRYDANGQAVGNEFQVNTTTANGQTSPKIVVLQNGEFVIAWNSYDQDGSGDGVYAQRYDATGQTIGAEFQVNTVTALTQSLGGLTGLADGSFVVTWASENQDGDGYGIYARHYATDQPILLDANPNGLHISTQTVYDAQGRVVETIDPNGVVTQMHYDRKGQVVSVIIDPEGLSLSTFYRYDNRGQQLSVSVGGQPNVFETKDENGNPILDSNGNPVEAYAKAISTTSYQYDSHGRLVSETIDPTVTWTDNQNVEHTETGLNITKQYHYDAQGNVAAQTNARGYTTRTVHDAFGRLIYTFAECELDQALVTKNQYDGNGRLVSVIQYANTVSLYGVDTVMTLDEADALVNGLDSSDDRLQQQVYDTDGRLIYTISPSGLISENVYDDNNNIIQTIAYSNALALGSYNSVSDVQAALTAANDSVAEHNAWSVYDANGRALYNINGLGYVTANEYDNNGNLTQSTRYATAIDTAILNDTTDNRAQLDALIASLSSSADQETRYLYDNANRQVYAIDAQGYITQTDYDAAGQVRAVIEYADAYVEANGLPTTTTAADRITQSAYDGAGRMISTRDGEGGIEQFDYDIAGNRTEYTDANGNTWTYRYDAANRMIEERSPVVAVTQLDATLFEESFNTSDISSHFTGELTQSGATHALSDDRLTLRNNAQGTDLEASLVGARSYEFNLHRRFETTFTVGEDIQAVQLAISAGNLQSSSAGRYHSLYVANGTLVSAYYDGTDITHTPIEGITLQANQTYIVEIGSETRDVNGVDVEYSTLLIYTLGQSRDEAFVDRKQTDWSELSGPGESEQTYALAFTSKANQATTDAVHIDHLRELMPQERALMNEAAGLSSQSSQQSIVTKIEYNAMGDVTARIEAAGTANERRTQYVYDTMNRQTITIYPEVGVYSYNDENLNYASSRQDTLQTLSSHTYYDVFGNEVVGVDTAGNRRYKVYDDNNRLVYDIDANGYVTENEYDAFGNVTTLTRYATAIDLPSAAINASNPGLSISDVEGLLSSSTQDRRLLQTYDTLNRVVRVEQPSVSVAAALDANGNATVATATPTMQNEYDSFGRLIKQSVLASSGWLDHYFYYDHNGRQVGTVDPMGYVTLTEYDSVGNVTRQIEYAKAINLNSANLDLNDFASVQNHIISSTAVAGVDSAAGFDRETMFIYDRLNRVISQTQKNVLISEVDVANAGTDDYDATFMQSVTDLTSTFIYDSVGNIVQTIDSDGNSVFQSYDALGRLTGQTEVTRSQLRYGLTTHTTLLLDHAGGDSATLRWARPPIPGLTTQLNVRAAGSSNAWTTLSVTESANQLEALMGHLPSDQYEYELSYTRAGESDVYATATGTINVDTNKASGGGLNSQHIAYHVEDKGNTLYISGNTSGITGVSINNTVYTNLNALGDGNYSLDISALSRGNYSFTTVGATNNLTGTIQKLTGALGGEFAIQTADIEIQYEIVEQAKFHYTEVEQTSSGHSYITNGYWGDNRLEITVPSLERLGTEDLRYEMVLEFSNAYGVTQERSFGGTVTGNTIVFTHSDGFNLGQYEPGHLVGVVSIQLKRGDIATATHITRHNHQLEQRMQDREGIFNGDYSYTETTYHDYNIVFEATGGVDTQQLEFINLPDDAETAVFTFWPSGGDPETAVERQLNKIGPGYFSIGHRDIPPGIYDYEIRINGSDQITQSGSNFAMGNGIDGYTAMSQPDLSGTSGEALITPLTRYQHDHFGNIVSATRYANSAQFNPDGTVNVTAGAQDQTQYNDYDTHGHVVHQQDGEGHGTFYSYDERGNLAKQWQWITTDANANVAGDRLLKGMVYRYDATGQKIENIEIAENINVDNVGIDSRAYTQASTQVQYNAFGEVTNQSLVHKHAGQADAVLRTEYFDYDQAGRVWRSNSEDGVDKIYLYDVQGNLVQQLLSQGRDLQDDNTYGYNALSATAGLSSDIMKTSYLYDDLGRVLTQIMPGRVQDGTPYDPQITMQLDRWGNVTQQTDAAGIITNVRYNQADQQIKLVQAVGMGVEVIDETGAASNVNPTTQTYYDQFGRQIGSVDANGNERVSQYDEAGQTVGMIAGDGGIQRKVFDAFGNQIEQVVFTGADTTTPYITTNIYDRNNRLVSEMTPAGGETTYTYNEAGDRTSVRRLANIAVNGDRTYETTVYRYDNRGNLIEEILNAQIDVFNSVGGLVLSTTNNTPVEHRYGYDMQGNKILEQMYKSALETDTLTASWAYDYFGRLTDHVDFGGGNYDYTYNHTGQILEETVTRGTDTQTKTYVYYNDGLLNTLSRSNLTDTYEYDINGRITREYSNNGNLYDNHYTYDALGRLTQFTGTGMVKGGVFDQPVGQPSDVGRGYWLDMQYQYDALGNRRRVFGSEGMTPSYEYYQGHPEHGGTLESVAAVYGVENIDQWYTYDAENRVLISRGILDNNQIKLDQGELVGENWEDAEGSIEYTYDKAGNRIQANYFRANGATTSLVTENHFYDADGRVVQTTEGGQYTSQRSYDLLGRVLTYTAYSSPGTPSEHRVSTYNDNGQLATQTIYQADSNGNPTGTVLATLKYDYADSYDHTGALTHYSMAANGSTNNYYYSYQYFESGRALTIDAANGSDSNTATHAYDAFGNLLSISNSSAGQAANNSVYEYNAAGQMVYKGTGLLINNNRRDQFYYLFNGRIIGSGGELEVDFDYNGTPLSNGEAVSGPSQYAVRAGDTLRGIALAVYGDANRWYLIADANGLSGDGDLTVGQTLIIPGNVQSLRNSSDAFRVYNSSELIGDSTPRLRTAAMGQSLFVNAVQEEKSNGFVQVVAIVVEIVVTYVLRVTPLAPIAGIIGNLAGQAVRIIGGEQDGIDMEELAIAAFSTSIGNAASTSQNAATRAVQSAVVSNLTSQGLSIAMGRQENFSWSSLATSAITANMGNGASQTQGFSGFAGRLGTGLLKGAIGETLRSAEYGADYEANWDNVALNAFGQAVGNSIVGEMNRSRTIGLMEQVNAELGVSASDVNDDNAIEMAYRNKDSISEGLNQLKAANRLNARALPDIEVTFAPGVANDSENQGTGGTASVAATAVQNVSEQTGDRNKTSDTQSRVAASMTSEQRNAFNRFSDIIRGGINTNTGEFRQDFLEDLAAEGNLRSANHTTNTDRLSGVSSESYNLNGQGIRVETTPDGNQTIYYSPDTDSGIEYLVGNQPSSDPILPLDVSAGRVVPIGHVFPQEHSLGEDGLSTYDIVGAFAGLEKDLALAQAQQSAKEILDRASPLNRQQRAIVDNATSFDELTSAVSSRSQSGQVIQKMAKLSKAFGWLSIAASGMEVVDKTYNAPVGDKFNTGVAAVGVELLSAGVAGAAFALTAAAVVGAGFAALPAIIVGAGVSFGASLLFDSFAAGSVEKVIKDLLPDSSPNTRYNNGYRNDLGLKF